VNVTPPLHWPSLAENKSVPFFSPFLLFAIYQGSQGMQEFAKQRSAEAYQKAETQQSEQLERPDEYIESLRLKEVETPSF